MRFSIDVQIEPMSGHELLRLGGDECLVVRSDDHTRNVLLDTSIVATVLDELATGGLRDSFGRGLGTMWRIAEVAAPPGWSPEA